jgi:hypothetical protein
VSVGKLSTMLRTAAALTLTGAALAGASPALASLPRVGSGHRPGPDILYAKPPAAPQLENTGPWGAKPILVSGAAATKRASTCTRTSSNRNSAETDVFEVWADVARHYPLDGRWAALSGYSMGGIGTFALATRWPDLFGRVFPIVGFAQASLHRLGAGSRRIVGTRRGKVRFVGVADRRLLRSPRALRRYLRLAGL